MKQNILKRGFTLVELLVVIAILAVLATAVVIVLNPAELIKQARDSTRISDMAALNGAVSVFFSDVAPTSSVAVGNCTSGTIAPAASGATTSCSLVATTSIDGTGWVNLNFTAMASPPLSRLPRDPNTGSTSCKDTTLATCMYVWKSSSTVGVFEIDAPMESIKFFTGGSGHITDIDGGNNTGWYEVGTSLTLL